MSEIFKHDEAAAELKMHPATLHRVRNRGLIPYRKAGRWVRYTRADLDEYLENVKEKADGQPSNRRRKG